MNVSELNGPLLDYWAGKAEGKPVWIRGNHCFFHDQYGVDFPYSPSTEWSQGGPIIERKQLAIIPVMGGTRWSAERDVPTGGDDYEVYATYGETPLIAAMRCLVASRFGNEVEDAKE